MKKLNLWALSCAALIFSHYAFAADPFKIPPLSDSVFIDARFSAHEPVICGITNLPDGVTLSISVQKETGTTHAAGEKVVVHQHKFCTGLLRDYAASLVLEAGIYNVDIFMLPPTEGEPGYEIIGSRGRNLIGPLVDVMDDPDVPEGEVRSVDDKFTARFGAHANIIESNKVTIDSSEPASGILPSVGGGAGPKDVNFVGAFTSREAAEKALKQSQENDKIGRTYSIATLAAGRVTTYVLQSKAASVPAAIDAPDIRGLMLLAVISGLLGYGFSYTSRKSDLLKDTSRPEAKRREELVQQLIANGYIIQNQQSGLVTAIKQKPKFEILLFIVLCLFWIVPGILYLIWYATRRNEIRQFVIKDERRNA